MNDNFFILYRNMNLASSEEVYTFLAERMSKANIQSVKDTFYGREAVGSIQIDDGVVLPHIEDSCIENTSIVIIQLQKPIRNWSSTINNIDLVIGVLLSPSNKQQKIRVASFMKKLAYEENIIQLRTSTDVNQIENI